jgi:hypothetical protein
MFSSFHWPELPALTHAKGGDQVAAQSTTGLEPANTSNEPVSNEPDTGADVQQQGDFQGNY